MRRTARTAVAFAMILVLTLGFAANAAAEEAALSPERVTAAVENLVKRYYDFDSDNYKSYFSNLEPLVTPDEFEYLKRGAPGLMWSTLTADNAYDIAISTSYYAHFKRIVSMEPENGGDDYRGGDRSTTRSAVKNSTSVKRRNSRMAIRTMDLSPWAPSPAPPAR